MCDVEQARMPEGSDFQIEGAAMLKPWEAKFVQTRGTDNKSVLDERRNVVNKKRAEVSRLREAEIVII